MTLEFDLSDQSAQKLNAAQTDIKNFSRDAAQKALAFFENIGAGLKSVNMANDAQEEYIRLLTREAKSRGRQYSDITDLDLNAKKILFKKKEVVGGEDGDEAPNEGTEGSPEDGVGA